MLSVVAFLEIFLLITSMKLISQFQSQSFYLVPLLIVGFFIRSSPKGS